MLWEFSGPNMEVKRDSGLKDLLGTEIAVWSDSRGEEGLRGCTDCGRNRRISLVWQQRRDQGKQRIWERLSGHAHLTRVWCVFLHLCAWLAFFICILPAAPLENALARKRHSHTLYNPIFWMPSYFGTLYQALWTGLTCHQVFQLCSMPSAPSFYNPWAELWCQILNMPKVLSAFATPPNSAQTESSFLGFMSFITLGRIQSWWPDYTKSIQSWRSEFMLMRSSLNSEVFFFFNEKKGTRRTCRRTSHSHV